jgi:glycosyltransferase involved in cell wall biosynthesis
MAVESMACGTPVIVFDGTALPQTIGGSDNGFVVSHGDVKGLSNAIEKCLNDSDLIEKFRRNGLKHVESKHTFETYAHRYLDLYTQLAAG